MRCVLALCVLGAVLIASSAAAEQKTDDQIRAPAGLTGPTLSHRRALRLIVDSTTGWWFGDTLATTTVTLVPAKSLKKKHAAQTTVEVEVEEEEEEEEEEEQLSTAHLKDVKLQHEHPLKDLELTLQDYDSDVKGDSVKLHPVNVTVEASDVKAETGR